MIASSFGPTGRENVWFAPKETGVTEPFLIGKEAVTHNVSGERPAVWGHGEPPTVSEDAPTGL